MSEQTIINGWSIKKGDYLRDPEYDDDFIKNKKGKIAFEKAVYSVGMVIAIIAFFAIMTSMTSMSNMLH